MGRASSAKKVARAARAGGRTSQGPKRQLAFPIGIAAIVVVGALLVVFARSANEEQVSASPRVGDHIHAAYGIYVCDAFLPALTDTGPDTSGLHTHADGVAHIHPFANGASGRNATLSKWGETVGLDVGSESFTVDGTEYADGYDCNGQPAQVSLHVWPPDEPDAEPEVITSDIGAFRLDTDRQLVTLAVVPEGTEVPRPESAGELDQLSDLSPLEAPSTTTSAPATTLAPGATDTTPTTAAGSTDSTVAPTDAQPGSTETTVAP
jgi:hypothetical protein